MRSNDGLFGLSVLAWLAAAFVLVLEACAGGSATGGMAGSSAPVGPAVGAPQYVVGDRWQYRITDLLNMSRVSQLELEVVSSSGSAATMRVNYTDSFGRSQASQLVVADGNLRTGRLLYDYPERTLPEPLQLIQFPLQSGASWRQTMNTTNPSSGFAGQILLTANVEGREGVTVPAGSFDPLFVHVVLQLDDDTVFRTRTTVFEDLSYATEVKGIVKMSRRAWYSDKNSGGWPVVHHAERTDTELVSFRPGPAK